MNKRSIVILFLLQLIAFGAYPQKTDNDNRLRAIINTYGQGTIIMARPGVRETDLLSKNVSISSARDNKLEIVLSPLTIEWFITQQYKYDIVEDDEIKGIVTASDTR